MRRRKVPSCRRRWHSGVHVAVMSYIILIDDKPVETADGEDQARRKAEHVQTNARRYVDDEFGGAFAVVGFAPKDDLKSISYLKPRDSVPDALVPVEFRQFR